MLSLFLAADGEEREGVVHYAPPPLPLLPVVTAPRYISSLLLDTAPHRCSLLLLPLPLIFPSSLLLITAVRLTAP